MKVLYISRAEFERRWLLPAYRLNDSVVAWECATCGNLFSIPVGDAERSNHVLPPQHIEREFRQHNCELQLTHQFSDAESSLAGKRRGT
jgi:hypothetical protein